MPDGTDVTGLNYPTEAELESIVFYGWDRASPSSQFKVRVEDLGGVSGGGSAAQEWAPNWTGDASWYLPVKTAMTIGQGNPKIGTGTITFEKSTAAAPDTFAAATLPVTLEAGSWLKVSAADVDGFCATHLVKL